MVDPVTNSAISALIRTGTNSATALQKNPQAAKAVISQLQQGFDHEKASANQSKPKTLAPGGGTLPRGSIVDVTV